MAHDNRRLLIWTTVLLALAQAIAPAFSFLTGLGTDITRQATQNIVMYPEVPAGYAFSIWSVIFVYALLYALNGLRFRSEDTLTYETLGWMPAIIFLTGTLWMLLDQIFGSGWYLVALIIPMGIVSLKALMRALELPHPYMSFQKRIVIPMLGLYSGWLSVAMFLNLGVESRDWVHQTFELSQMEYALLPLMPAMALTSWMIVKTNGNAWYAFPVLWALVGIIVTNIRYFPDGFILPLALGLLVSTAGLLYFARRQQRQIQV